jgi:hypothetical protein
LGKIRIVFGQAAGFVLEIRAGIWAQIWAAHEETERARAQVHVNDKPHLMLRFWPDDNNVRLVEVFFVPPVDYRSGDVATNQRDRIPWTNGMRAFALFLILAKAGQLLHETADRKHWLDTLRKAREDNANPVDKVLRIAGSLRFLQQIATVHGRPPGPMSVTYNERLMPLRDVQILVEPDKDRSVEMRTPERLLGLAEHIKRRVPSWQRIDFIAARKAGRTDPLADIDLEPVPKFEIHPEPKLRDVLKSYTMELGIYGQAAAWPKDVYVALWRKFRQGGQVLYRNGKPVGGIGMYPLTHSVAAVVKSGEVSDAAIARLLIDCARHRPVQCWYLSTIELVPGMTRWRERSEAVTILLSQGIPNIVRAVKMLWPIEVLSFGWSESGLNLLKRFGFKRMREPEQTKDGWPLFSLHLRSEAVLARKLTELTGRKPG